MQDNIESTCVQISHEGNTQLIALYPGLAVEELVQLLGSIFDAKNAVGFECNGTTIPLGVACQNPHCLVGGEYTLLLGDASAAASSSPSSSSPPSQLLNFIDTLGARNTISASEKASLIFYVQNNDELLLAAFEHAEDTGQPQALVKTMFQLCQNPDASLLWGQRQLVQAIRMLRKGRAITAEQELELIRRLFERDEIIFAALEAYIEDKDEEELVDTLLRIARLSSVAPQTRMTDELVNVIQSMKDTGAIGLAEQRLLRSLVVSKNEYIMAAFEVYENDQDQEELRDTLLRVVRIYAAGSTSSSLTANAAPSTDSAVEGVAASADSAPSGSSNNGDYPSRELLEFVQLLRKEQMVTADDARLVRKLIAHRNNLLLAAMEAYQADGDAEELKDTLFRIIKFQQQSEQDVGPTRSAGSDKFDHVLVSMVKAEHLTNAQAERLQKLHRGGHEMVVAAWEVFRLEESLDDLMDTLVRVLRLDEEENEAEAEAGLPTAARSTLLEVVSKMVEGGQLEAEGGERLAKLVEEGNPVMHAAFEAFEADHDIAELLDTLQLVASYPAKQDESVSAANVSLLADLSKKGMLSAEQAAVLTELSRSGNGLLQAAFQVYKMDSNLRELMDTLVRIAQKHNGAAANSTASSASNDAVGDASVELLELIDALEADDKLSELEALVLKGLVEIRDENVMAAHDIYVADQDVDDLIDTLQLIAKRAVRDEDEDENSSLSSEDVSDNDVDEDLMDRLGKMKSLYSRQLLGKDEAKALMELLRKDTPKLMAAFDVYDSIQDEEDLVDTLKRIARHYSRADGGSDDGGSDDEQSKGEDGSKSTDELTGAIEELLFKNVADWTAKETAALRDRLNADDIVVKAALKVFQIEQDADDLKDTLLRVARYHARQAAKKDGDDEPAEKDEEDADEDSDEDEDEEQPKGLAMLKSSLTAGQHQELVRLHAAGNLVVAAALDVFRLDGDLDELQDTVTRVLSADSS
jgi:hypothetical protein